MKPNPLDLVKILTNTVQSQSNKASEEGILWKSVLRF